MAMSKESNKNIARRWREDLAKKREKEAILTPILFIAVFTAEKG